MTSPHLLFAAGFLAACGGWLVTRSVSGRLPRFGPWLLLDAALPAALFTLVLLLSGRPLFAGVVTLCLGAGFTYAERAKRRTLGEPIVFTDVFQTFDIFRHPQLAMPFPNLWSIALAVLLSIAAFATLYALEPAFLGAGRWLLLPLLLAVLAMLVALVSGPLNAPLARALRRAGLSGEPFEDAARLGTLGTLLGYGLVARAERPVRCAAAAPIAVAARAPSSTNRISREPVLLVQCESFFDARRLGGFIAPDLLPAFDHLRGESLQWGRLAVPCWGANTVRTEFAVLSGLGESALGLDRFNPYHRFARQPLRSVASQLRARGYRTICLHPFDRRFYARDAVMPQLGFDTFIGEEAFAGAERINGFIADAAIADVVETLVAEHRGGVFVFVITLENHGPWATTRPLPEARRLAATAPLAPPQAAALESYLASLRNGDALLSALTSRIDDGRLVGFYGDHQPSLPMTMGRNRDNSSDYLLWRAGMRGDAPQIDLTALALGGALLARL
jgi:hypothetical protein